MFFSLGSFGAVVLSSALIVRNGGFEYPWTPWRGLSFPLPPLLLHFSPEVAANPCVGIVQRSAPCLAYILSLSTPTLKAFKIFFSFPLGGL